MEVRSWQLVRPAEPLEARTWSLDVGALGGGDVVVEVAGCGVCHTDLGFAYEGVRTRHPLPLTLGHEISGRVVAAKGALEHLVGKAVVVPAVIPCGECDACRRGRGAVCGKQMFPGNDGHGGFASHVVVPGRGLCEVPEAALAAGVSLSDLSVIADAVTTPYQAILNAGLRAGDVAIFVGAGGVGSFGVQIAAALGAHVVALDVDASRLERAARFGASLTVDSAGDPRAVRDRITGWVKEKNLPRIGWKIFETSGHPAGQELAFGLLGPDGHLGVVGFTREKVSLRLSNLMAFDATARGTWGCLPEHYPAVVELVAQKKIALEPFIERRPMSRLTETFEALRRHELVRRPVMIPDFS